MQKNQSEKRVVESRKQALKAEVPEVVCYRLKCAESGNGLSHYIMYGDLPQEVVDE